MKLPEETENIDAILSEVLNVKKYLIKIAQNVLKYQLICLLKYI